MQGDECMLVSEQNTGYNTFTEWSSELPYCQHSYLTWCKFRTITRLFLNKQVSINTIIKILQANKEKYFSITILVFSVTTVITEFRPAVKFVVNFLNRREIWFHTRSQWASQWKQTFGMHNHRTLYNCARRFQSRFDTYVRTSAVFCLYWRYSV